MCEDNPCVPGIQPKRDGYTFDGWVLRNSSESCSSSIDITIHGVQNSIFDACWK